MSSVVTWEEAKHRPRAHDPEGFARVFVGDDSGAERLRMHVSVVGPGQKSHDPHAHEGEEIIYVLEGRAEFAFRDRTVTAGPQTSVFVGSGEFHGIRNAGDGILKYMIIRTV